MKDTSPRNLDEASPNNTKLNNTTAKFEDSDDEKDF